MLPKLYLILLIPICIFQHARAQDSLSKIDKVINFPSSFLSRVNKKTATIEAGLTRQTEKYLTRLAKKEARLKKKLYRLDSTTAKNCFADDPRKQYQAYIDKLASDTGAGGKTLQGTYLPYVDSLKTSLAFLNAHPELLSSSKLLPEDVQKSVKQLQSLQSKMQQTNYINDFLQQRAQYIKGALSQYTKLPKGIPADLNDYNKQLYYYKEQVKAYKDMLNDPDKMLKTALGLLNKVPAFTDFMKKNSMLASLFNIPGGATSAGAGQAVTGMQTRSQVMTAIQNQVGGTVPNVNAMTQQNLQSAQGQINGLRDKLNSVGGGNGDLNMPNFKPNSQKTKGFFNRLEYGTNIQSAQSSSFFPTTTDLGFSVGYKLNDRSTIGVGTSYKIGWGKNIRHITITQEGMSLRTFMDVKLKGSFFASGGFEYNYQPMTPDSSVAIQAKGKAPNLWQQSGLIGVSKILSLKSNVFKKTKVQLLWDFLSYRQSPQTQAFKFRIGYNF